MRGNKNKVNPYEVPLEDDRSRNRSSDSGTFASTGASAEDSAAISDTFLKQPQSPGGEGQKPKLHYINKHGSTIFLTKEERVEKRKQELVALDDVKKIKKVATKRRERPIFQRRWDLTMFMLLAIISVVTPVEIAFHEVQLDWMFVFNRLLDIVFIGDIVVNFYIPVMDMETGRMVNEAREIAIRYIRGWFIVDVLSVLPFDLIVLFAEIDASGAGAFKFVKFLRLLRLVKLLRVLRATRIIARWQARVGIKYAILSLGKYAIFVLILAHWGACLFAITARMTDGEATWMDAYIGVVDDSTIRTQYIAAFYWSTMTVTTIGYGDVSPQTDQERLMACACMFMGGAFYAVIIGSICGLVTQMDQATNEFYTSMDHLNVYMEDVKLPVPLRIKLRRFFHHSKGVYKHKFNQRVMIQMSPGLRKAFCLHVHQKWISQVKFFNHPDEPENTSFIAALSLVMEMEPFPPSEAIVVKGEQAHKLYVVENGLVAENARVMRQGYVVGAEMIMRSARRENTVLALTFTDTLSLTRNSLMMVLGDGRYPRMSYFIRRAAIKLAILKEFVRVGQEMRRMMESGLYPKDFKVVDFLSIIYGNPLTVVSPEDAEDQARINPLSRMRGSVMLGRTPMNISPDRSRRGSGGGNSMRASFVGHSLPQLPMSGRQPDSAEHSGKTSPRPKTMGNTLVVPGHGSLAPKPKQQGVTPIKEESAVDLMSPKIGPGRLVFKKLEGEVSQSIMELTEKVNQTVEKIEFMEDKMQTLVHVLENLSQQQSVLALTIEDVSVMLKEGQQHSAAGWRR